MVTISPAQVADVAIVAELAHRIWHRHYPGIISVGQIEYMLARGYASPALAKFLDDEGSGLIVARQDGAPVGFAAWQRTDRPATSKLDKLYVLQELHRRGVGRLLVAHVEREARADGATTLVLNVNKDNAGAIAAYRRLGFFVRGEVVVDIGNGYVMDDYVMAKAL